jgi:endonuclease/exonuclease/phosphatase family metal-dependent hydrolase
MKNRPTTVFHRAWNRFPSGFVIWAVSILMLTGCQYLRDVRKERPAAVAATHRRLTVMSYNIRVGYGGKDRGVNPYILSKREENLPPIIAAIQSIDPDIIGLQEVRGSGQARRLAQALGMNYAYTWHETDDLRPRWWGVAILSKYPIVKSERIQLTSEKGNTKSALICTAEINDRPATFISIHTARDRENRASFEGVMKAVEKIGSPVVLIGDFNMDPGDPRMQLLHPRFVDTALAVDTESAENARTTGTFRGIGRIDYVLVDNRYFEVLDAGIISRQHWEASDHLAYFTRVIFKPLP